MPKVLKMFMIRMSTVTKLLLTATLLFCFELCGFSKGYARLALSVKTVDLGVVYTDSAKRVVEVPFINKGKEPLKIREARPDCTCTYVEYPREKVQPGGKGVLRITIDLTNLLPAKIDKKVGFYSNSKKSPVVLYIKGTLTRKE